MAMAYLIAIDAGHYLHTPGKRVDKALDPAQTREWVLNNRIANYMAEAAKAYGGLHTFRVDDPTGKKEVTLAARCAAANSKNADLYISVHHNAGINLGSGGGIVVFSYAEGTKAARLRDGIYDACIAAGGLKGNRSTPKQSYGYYVLKHTKAPAVLVEYGFMDSKTDATVILTEDYAKAMGYATILAIADFLGVKKQTVQDASAENKSVCTLPVSALKKGDKGAAVKAMQILLMGYGYGCGSAGADGDFGSNTDKALRSFQQAKSLAVDGICGANTWKKLLGV